MVSQKPVLVIVIPCFNEGEVLPITAQSLSEKISFLVSKQLVSAKSGLLFVDDGSGDNTWTLIEKFHRENPLVFGGIKLSANRGHQNALLCGMLAVKDHADAVITMDADLQDDIDSIDQMLESFLAGSEIVCGVRSDRKSDGFLKRTSARAFYRFMVFLGAGTIYNHADFRLIGKKALQALAEYNEANLFLRGIVPQLGYKTGIVYYERKKRFAGISKYHLRKMLKLALDGITSFSVKPLRCITLLGILLLAAALIMAAYFIFRKISGYPPYPLAVLICSLWGIGGLIVSSIGIMGEYTGKIYMEIKRRPRYHVEQFLFRQE